jgi:tRNA1Val (adenine37-N6)-methyltransferase
MKVSSDSCLLGAYVPVDSARRILDIGTGTGVLALMTAQRSAPGTIIDGVEICSKAAETARRNVAASPFAHMVRIFEGRIQTFVPEGGIAYDLILSNPPFFQKALPNQHLARTIARHAREEGMDFTDLVASACRLLAADGQLWLLLPPPEMETFVRLAEESHLFEWERLTVQHKPSDPPNRIISSFGRFQKPLKKKALVRCLEDGTSPSPEVRTILRDYMLFY